MKVLGISGSPRKSQTTEGLVKTVLDATGLETELISFYMARRLTVVYVVLVVLRTMSVKSRMIISH
ncbi:MAG: hypothetical protein ACUZ77_11170 [Candidatus Brocadiales bacterium]